VAVQGDDWVNHLLMGDWAHKGLWHRIVVFHPSPFARKVGKTSFKIEGLRARTFLT
jgi:hypothetical protein